MLFQGMDGGKEQTNKLRRRLVFPQRQQEIPPIITLLPLQHLILINQVFRGVDIPADTTRVTARADGCSGEFYANSPGSRGGVVFVFANPRDVGDPVAVAVTGEEDVVGDIVGVEMLERAVAVSEVGLFN